MDFRRCYKINFMKKLIYLLFLFPIISTAQMGAIASSYYVDSRTNNFISSAGLEGERQNNSSYRFVIRRFSKNLLGHSNSNFSTALAETGRFDTIMAVFFPMIGTVTNSTRFEFVNNTVQTRLDHSNVTITTNGCVYNGTSSFSTLVNNGYPANPRSILDTLLGRSTTDTVANIGFNMDIFLKDSADRSVFFSYNATLLPNTTGLFDLANNVGVFSYNNSSNSNATNASITDCRGLLSSNRVGLTNQAYLRGSSIVTKTSSSYDFSLARNSTSPMYIGSLNTIPTYYAATVQGVCIRKRGLTASEQTLWDNIWVEMNRTNLGRY